MTRDAADSTSVSSPTPRRKGIRTTVNPPTFQCPSCTKSFSKSEHLTRHERSHSGSRPFICKKCKKPFARQDSLLRHSKLHIEDHHSSANASDANNPNPPQILHEYGVGDHQQSSSISHHIGSPSHNRLPAVSENFTADENISSPPSVANVRDAIDINQAWPNSSSEDLLQLLMSDTSAWPITLPMMDLSNLEPEGLQSSGSFLGISQASGQSRRGYQAVEQMNQLIRDLSSNLSNEVETSGMTSEFLDTCLNMFFNRFIPSFPVMQRSTFVSKDCAHPLLLNIIALGSLFVAAPAAIRKGECLWRLAHTAVATSWQGMLQYSSSLDACNGVQLVLTALLGQTYAFLSKIRTTSQIFHGLGFYWARQCNMYKAAPFNMLNVVSSNLSETEKEKQWKIWVANETQKRAVLGHYILDGLISQTSGHATSVRHVTNPILLPSWDNTFEAKSADEWMSKVERAGLNTITLREVYIHLFDDSTILLKGLVSSFSIRIVLEGLQSLISDHNEAGGFAIGTPTKPEIVNALVRLKERYIVTPLLSGNDVRELSLRWHVICINAIIDTNSLACKICRDLGISQELYNDDDDFSSVFVLRDWVRCIDGRRALLHAIAIQEIMEQLPMGRCHAIHIPAAVFCAATIYFATQTITSSSVLIPIHINWKEVWSINLDASPTTAVSNLDIQLYLAGSFFPEDQLRYTKNLLGDLNRLQMCMRSMSSTWGICCEMENVINGWISMLNIRI